jgi:hypothetical protein
MYAHKLLANIVDSSFLKNKDKDYDERKEYVLDKVKTSAVHFSFGDYDQFLEICGTASHDKNLAKFLKLPYECCFFMSNQKKECAHIGLLVENSPDPEGGIDVYALYYSLQARQTLFLPLMLHVLHDKWGIAPMIKDYKENTDSEAMIKLLGSNSKDLVCAATYLLNTKNLVLVDNNPPPKLQKKRNRKGKLPLHSYKTLEIKLPGSAKKATNGSGQGNLNRIHLCRGHFKEYTEENPLFGKYTGLYWWQPHARGSKEKGIINKDYNVITEPKPSTQND